MVSTVSTRGVKFKFSEGERVLCYEPDPTKAKVLYESKVLDLVVSRDERGRKIPEYLIHFFGWNSSWDRCVREEFILPYNEENSDLQTKLATDAALTIKGKRKIKLPPLIKETLAKKQCSEAAKQKSEKHETSADSSSDTDSSEEEYEKEVIINIPEVLKKQLEEDYKYITKENKFVKLPCKPNVIAILEAYVKHLAAKLLCASPPKNVKNGKQLMPNDVKNKLNLCKEAMDGIRVYFDFTLPHLLLYELEKKQHYTEGINCSPISHLYKWDPQETVENVVVKIERLEDEVAINSSSKNSSTPVVKMELENILPSRSRSKKSLRSHPTKTSPNCKQENMTNGETDRKTTNFGETIKKEGKFKHTPTRDKPKPATTRILRSSEKQKAQPPKEDSTPKTSSSSPPPITASDSKRSSPTCPNLTLALEQTNSQRVTRKTTLQNMSPPRISSPTLPLQTSQMFIDEKPIPPTSTPVINPIKVLPAFPLASNCVSSSNSSSHSTFSNPTISHQFHLINNEALLQEIQSWRLVPQELYEAIPATPSLIYGSQHLLRLFGKKVFSPSGRVLI